MGTHVEADGSGLRELIAAMEADAKPIRAAIEVFMQKRQCVVDSVDCETNEIRLAGGAQKTVFRGCVINARLVSGNSEIPIRIRV